MTGVQVSTRPASDERLRHQTKSVVYTGVKNESRILVEPYMSIFSSDSVGDSQTLDIYVQDDQISTRDIVVDTERQTYRTTDIPSTAFMGAPVGYGMADKQLYRNIDAIAHMDDKEVINELKERGLAGVAKRLKYLYDITEEDEEDIKLDSLRGFATLVIKNCDMHMPQITVTDDGLIQAVWKHPRQGTLVMDFQESGDVEFTLLYGRWDQGTKRRKLNGVLYPDKAMLHVGHFVYAVMWT